MNYILQLKSILKASGWSQEQLACELSVSFPTLNAWLNRRSKPRTNARLKIEMLYINVVGAESIYDTELAIVKNTALDLKLRPSTLISNENMLHKLTIYITYHTNTIEGSTMTLSDVEEVIFANKVLSNRTAVEQAEARNHQSALLWVLEQLVENGESFTIDEELILGIHLRLMNGIMSDAGKYRKHSIRIMGTHVVLANWIKVPELLVQLIKDLSKSSKDIVSELAKAHATFEQVHPFSDGNGRVGRLLMFAQALRAGLVPPLVVKERRYAYYKYLEIAQTTADYSLLELFIAQSMQSCHKILTIGSPQH
ncbi:MAG: Fic family protein [Actinobacteria bacterium]|nr:Fic family protein [Actinomycetota bacterium]MCL6104566.1 Fic family protein [Actinomycetota bacterium]